MAAYEKFDAWVDSFHGGADLVGSGGTTADQLVAYLTNVAPNRATHAVKADLAEIATGNGYTGQVALANVGTRAAGVLTVTARSFQIAATGPIGPFQYLVIADSTRAGTPLVGWFDYGSPVTLANGETFPVLFNGAAVGSNGTLFTAQ